MWWRSEADFGSFWGQNREIGQISRSKTENPHEPSTDVLCAFDAFLPHKNELVFAGCIITSIPRFFDFCSAKISKNRDFGDFRRKKSKNLGIDVMMHPAKTNSFL